MEAAELERLDVIDLGAIEVGDAHGIHEELDALGLEDLVALPGLGLEVHVVGQTGATASDDHNTNIRTTITI